MITKNMQETQTTKRTMLPPLGLLLALLGALLLHFAAPVWVTHSALGKITGIVLIGIGLLLNVVADRQFKNHQTTIRPGKRSAALVQGGVYHYTRNPMYLGMVLVLAGVVLGLGSLSPWLAVLGFGIWVQVRFITLEEAMLAEQFGDAWNRYTADVRRWI